MTERLPGLAGLGSAETIPFLFFSGQSGHLQSGQSRVWRVSVIDDIILVFTGNLAKIGSGGSLQSGPCGQIAIKK